MSANDYQRDPKGAYQAMTIPCLLSDAELAEIVACHEQSKRDIQNNFGAAYSSRIGQDKYSIHADRERLLAHISALQVPVVTREQIETLLRTYSRFALDADGTDAVLAILGAKP